MRALVLASILATLAACGGPSRHHRARHPRNHPDATPTPGQTVPDQGQVGGAAAISWARVSSEAAVSSTPPPAGIYRVHLIDVGTGLSILVQGHDFAMLYDAGSNDRDEKPIRVVAYLAAALGPSGDDTCVDAGHSTPSGRIGIANVVLSHPHFDHASAMALVVHCYDVANLWDSGRVNDAVFYKDLVATIAQSAVTTYHTAADVPADRAMRVKGSEAHIARWQQFADGDHVELGAGARFTILHADAKKLPDPNQNSVVLAVELGGARLLLVGDTESGERRDPSDPPGDVEQFLLEHHAAELRADILQVGHHGSKTSSRHAFLAAVHPSLALVSSGPKVYGHTVLPDHEVLEELAKDGATVLRTDEHDAGCPNTGHRLGGDDGPGGCDSYIITIGPK